MDLNWDSHPFRVADAGYDGAKIVRMRDMLEFYEDMMFWANDWDSPKDAMHHQMGYNTYNNPKLQDFVNRKIRSDGFSTYKRGALQDGAVLVSSVDPKPVSTQVSVSGSDQLESRSGYRTPGEGAIGNITVIELNQDAMLHQLFVEWSAIQLGDTESVYRVIRSAAGKGADTSHSFITRAKAVLARVPADDLKRVLTRIEIVDPDLLKSLIGQGRIV
jgi:hypothetical protein